MITKPTVVVGKKKSKVVARKKKSKAKAKVTKGGPATASSVVTLGTEPAKEPGRRRLRNKATPFSKPALTTIQEAEPAEKSDGKEAEESDKHSEEGEESDDQYPKVTKEREAEILKVSLEEAAAKSKEADEKDDDKSTPSSPNGSGDEQSDEDKENSVLEFEERDLSVSTSFTLDEDLCLSYFMKCGDNLQPRGKNGRFTRNNLQTLIKDTKKGYCLLIPNGRNLQLLHSAFMWEDWVYAAAGTSGVNDYWIRIPVKSLIKKMSGLDFERWKTQGQPVRGKGILTLKGLIHESSSFHDFLSRNKLKEVAVSVALNSSRPGSATLVTGDLYALLCKHVG